MHARQRRWAFAGALALLALAAPAARAQTGFAGLVARLSEPAGFFDSDNLVSNETSYLHPLGQLRAQGIRGGVYLGVGPEQNFSYIAEIQPEYAILVDIRRDNQLLHLLFKAMFERARTRAEFMGLLFGRPAPRGPAAFARRALIEHLFYLDTTAFDSTLHERQHADLLRRVAGYGVPLSDADRATMRRFHDEFARAGLNLTFTSRGGIARRAYPNLRRLYQETDLAGETASYLASEERWLRVRALHLRHRIIPVVGDLAGRQALPAIARWLEDTGQRVSAFYVSNVEMYLFRYGTFGAFAENVRALPAMRSSVLIRSIFDRYILSTSWPGHFSAQQVQPFTRFLELADAPMPLSYWGLITDADSLAGRP